MDSADSRKENDVTILNGDFFKGHSEKRKKMPKPEFLIVDSTLLDHTDKDSKDCA